MRRVSDVPAIQLAFCSAVLVATALLTVSCNRDAQRSYPAYAAAQRLPLEVCNFDGVEEPLLCGVFTVFENRALQSGRTIPIKVVVIPAQQERTTNSAWIEHQGGPRYSMVAGAPSYAEGGSLEYFRRHRDIVLLDPRGLHESGALFCEALMEIRILEPYYPADRVRACREELEKQFDLKQYSTLNAIDDYEDIRRWLGYEQWDVGGWSFGSRFMLTYIHRYPESIRTASLFIPAILNFDRPLNYARFGQRALELVIEDCRAEPACNERFPDLEGDLARVLTALEEQPATVEFIDPHTGQPTTRELIRGVFTDELWVALLYHSREVPRIIHSAANGDFGPLVELFVPEEPEDPEPEGHYWSVVCPEETNRLDPEKVIEAAEGTFGGTYMSDEYMAACEAWGLPTHPEHPIEAQTFDIPALIVTGDQDPVTPPEYGEEIAGHFANPLYINVPHMAHGPQGLENATCLDDILSAFVDSGTTEGLDISCIETMRPAPFRLE